MILREQKRFEGFYAQHLCALKLQGLSASRLDVYARAVRRIAKRYDCCPDQLTLAQLKIYFTELVNSILRARSKLIVMTCNSAGCIS
ncbi:MAG: hypothetical protein K0U40_05875 [Betaproteobacteria bacterium]|nr:hypothetical protein [Betaproteobacteria bacterium]